MGFKVVKVQKIDFILNINFQEFRYVVRNSQKGKVFDFRRDICEIVWILFFILVFLKSFDGYFKG